MALEEWGALLLVMPVAFVFGPSGLGGGILYVPLLHYVAGWSLTASIATSLVLVWSVSLGSRLAHSRAGHADKVTSRQMLRGALPGAGLGALLSWLFADTGDLPLKIILAALAGWAVYQAARRLAREGAASETGSGVLLPWRTRLTAGVGGTASTLLGVGGGVVYVPTARFFGGLDSRDAVGTSNLVMSVVVPFSIVFHLATQEIGEFDLWMVPLALAVGAVAAFTGARLAITYVSPRTITWVFVVILVIVELRYLWDFGTRLWG